MKKKQILIGVCGSFCNHARVLEEFKKLTEDYDLHFVISEQVASTSTRFFEKSSFHQLLQSLSNTEIIKTICDSEPIGPRNIYDLMMIAPATATTIGKLANGIYFKVVDSDDWLEARRQSNATKQQTNFDWSVEQ